MAAPLYHRGGLPGLEEGGLLCSRKTEQPDADRHSGPTGVRYPGGRCRSGPRSHDYQVSTFARNDDHLPMGAAPMKCPIRTARASDEDPAIDAIVLAFAADPAARWTWPDPQQYLSHFPTFVRAFGGRAFAHKTAYCVDGYAGTALWLPPDVHPDEDALVSLLHRTAPERIQPEVSGVFEQMERYHPREPHWYLPLIGVDPSQQGKGYGSALMQHAPGLVRPGSRACLSSLRAHGVSRSMSDTGSNCWPRFKWEPRHPSFPCSAGHGDTGTHASCLRAMQPPHPGRQAS
jgi:GNAT superfamily N-acetyltransferase